MLSHGPEALRDIYFMKVQGKRGSSGAARLALDDKKMSRRYLTLLRRELIRALAKLAKAEQERDRLRAALEKLKKPLRTSRPETRR